MESIQYCQNCSAVGYYVHHCTRISTFLLLFGSFIKCCVYSFINTIISEKGDTKTKIEALKKTIHMIVSGERLPGLLMTMIRFVLPLQDHMIKKLLLIFWEIVPKTTPDGKLMQEMILVCDSYRKVSWLYSSGRKY
jgi:coatomer subunit beta